MKVSLSGCCAVLLLCCAALLSFSCGTAATDASLRAAREETEKAQIAKVLRLTGGNRKRAAELLEIDRSVLYDKMAKYGIGVGHHDV